MILFLFSCGVLLSRAEESAAGKGKAERVVVVVWDGMRPDMISPEHTPTLHALAQRGVNFKKHHAAYVSSTEVNGAVLATGAYPNRTTIIANREFRPDIDPLKYVDTQNFKAVRKGDEAGKYLGVSTIAEIVQAAGFPTIIAGAKPVALLQDRSDKRDAGAAKNSMNLFGGQILPERELPDLEGILGAFPVTSSYPNTGSDTWATRALTEVLWKNDVPKFSLLWLSEPDHSQHLSAPGSEMALAALKSSDDRLATVLAALEARGLRDSTDLLVVSDHGFSTISRSVNLPELLTEAGFTVASMEFKEPPQPADILAVGNGGEVSFYVIGHAENTTNRLVEFLQQSDFAGVIFTRAGIEGTFPLEQAHLNTPSAPDVVMSFRWKPDKNKFGVRGMIIADWNRKPGQGTHATLSPFEMNNTLVAAGPDFRKNTTSALPSGNVDIGPTVLWILGVKPPQLMDGRVLFEAMTTANIEKPRVSESRIKAERAFDEAHWRQYLKQSQVGTTVYLDEGNGEYGAEKD